MRVLLNTDLHTDGRQALSDYLESLVNEALGHYDERIAPVEAHLSDANSPAKANTDEIHRQLEARMVGHRSSSRNAPALRKAQGETCGPRA